MQTLTIKITNESNAAFLIELLQKFDFVTDVKVTKRRNKTRHLASNQEEKNSYEQNLDLLKEKYKDLPITWGVGKPEISDFLGIWKDKDISIEQLREMAWKRNW